MAKVIIETRFPPCKGKRNRGARSPLNRCAVCGRAVRTRGARLCPDCMGNWCAGGACAPLDLDKLPSAGEGVRT